VVIATYAVTENAGVMRRTLPELARRRLRIGVVVGLVAAARCRDRALAFAIKKSTGFSTLR
jgi:hypothetical protein